MTMVGSRFFVFGGQVDGEFLNDLWSFDLNSRTCDFILACSELTECHVSVVRTRASWELFDPSTTDKPAPRTGHVMVTYGDKVLLCVTSRPGLQQRSLTFSPKLDLVAPTATTTTTTPGYSMLRPGGGPN